MFSLLFKAHSPPLEEGIKGEFQKGYRAYDGGFNIHPLLGAQELDSDEPSLCVHQPGKTVNKECPRLRCRLSRIVRTG